MANERRGKDRTTIRLHGDEVVKAYEDLSKNAKKQHVIDSIGEMILNGKFDDKPKMKEADVLAYGNKDLFVEVKQKAKDLGYTNATELYSRVLVENEDDIQRYIKANKQKNK